MSAIYIHIPYCKTKCPYCDFFSVTNRQDEKAFMKALLNEIRLQKDYLPNNRIQTLYFGGGTPSLLSTEDLSLVFNQIYKIYDITKDAEITIECNPDDVSLSYFNELRALGLNRLSLGIQSFYDEDLKFLGRRHSAAQNDLAIHWAIEAGFENISIDLIYGLPDSKPEIWKQNLNKAFQYPFKHLSAYHLTIEPGTVFGKMLNKGKLKEISEENSLEQFRILMEFAQSEGFEHYELSSFALPGYHSRHNTGYWMQRSYLGLGPSAHSYNGESRQWNASSIKFYTDSLLNKEQIPFKREKLTTQEHFNEYLITRLRTQWGVDLSEINRKFGSHYKDYLLKAIQFFLKNKYINRSGNILSLTREGKFISDAIFRQIILSE
mgnify:CR=1 FL=1